MTDDLIAGERWHETAFGPLTAAFWAAMADPQTTEREAQFIAARLAPPAGARLLDLACGDGRHAHALARRGFDVVGLDSSAAMLALAGDDDSGATLVRADVRELARWGPFDGAVLWGNGFGYLAHAETLDLIARLASVLKPGAVFLMDYPAVAECVLSAFAPETRVEVNEYLFEARRRYEPREGATHALYRTTRDSQSEAFVARQFNYGCGDLVRMFDAAGFALEGQWSGVDGARFGLGDRRLIVGFLRR